MGTYQAFRRDDNEKHDGPYILLICHPMDESRWLDNLASRILEAADCTVLCGDEESLSFDDFDKISAAVFPVTHNLFDSPDTTLDTFISFAISERIPILPILVESDLEESFESKVGPIQLLSLNGNSSGPSVTRKLLDFFDRILPQNNIEETIKRAFKTKVFLSYRRKDYSHAKEVVSLIHKESDLQDIAIWFDDYLTPGERYDEEIKEAIATSDLFAMVASPALLVTPNYIVDNEYPCARNAGIPILSIEMQEADITQLKILFPSTQLHIRGHEKHRIIEEVRRISFNTESRATHNDYEHDYLIGLAYLMGIWVEIDRDLGLSLMLSAADKNYLPALEKLADMYRTGEAVQPDLDTEINLRVRIAALCKIEWKKKLTKDSFEHYSKALFDAGEAFQNDLRGLFGTPDKNINQGAHSYYATLIKLHEKVVFTNDYETAKRYATACFNLGRLFHREKNTSSAIFVLRKSIGAFRELQHLGHMQTEDYLTYAEAYEALADLFHSNQKYSRMELSLRECLAIYQKIEDKLSIELSVRMGAIAETLSELSIRKGNFVSARNWSYMADEHAKKLLEQKNPEAYLQRLSDEYESLANLAEENEEHHLSQKWLERALKAKELLLELSETDELISEIINCYSLLANTLLVTEDTDTAQCLYHQACSRFAHKLHDMEQVEWNCSAYKMLSQLALASGDVNSSLAWVEKELTARESELRQHEASTNIVDELACFSDSDGIADALLRKGDLIQAIHGKAKAIESYKRAAEIYHELAKCGTTEFAQGFKRAIDRLRKLQ